MTPLDNTGNEILEVIANAGKFNQWMYQTIKPFLNGNLLEIGSGIGNISSFCIQAGNTISLSDTDEHYIETLKTKFHSYPTVKNIFSIDLLHPNFEATYSIHKEQFDTVFLLNVLEHIEDDNVAINNCKFLLRQGGTLLILTPAYSFLYSRLDQALGHYRRYTTKRLHLLLQKNQLNTKKKFYFNAVGIVAWLYGKIRKFETIPSGEMGFFNKLVPLAKLIDKITFQRIGLSVIITGQKNN